MSTFYRGKGTGARRPQRTSPDKHRINDRIRAAKVRLIGDDGTQYGVLSLDDALRKAEETGMDVVEVSPNTEPPVCKLMDYGKYKYREQKKQSESKKKRAEVSLKELRVRYRTDVGDLETKLKRAREFLIEGDKVKFSMRFRGREAMFLSLGEEKFNEIAQRLSDVAVIDERSPTRGNFIYIVFAPNKEAIKSITKGKDSSKKAAVEKAK